tara:strand:+ start:1831 stop:3027 length:1197 start_codon:yes stop_codon:yes gene_type:complete
LANYALINPGKFHLGDPHDFPPRQNRRFDERNYISEIKWKTSVMLNKRVYIGNVKLVQSDGTERALSDSMFKSKSNKYDSFTLDRRIDVAVADGEEIIRLATFADRILQYKQNTLHVINATKSQEFLEASYKFKGVSHHNAVCEFDYGVAWCNQQGVYMYNGQQVIELTVKEGVRRFSQEAWEDFYEDGKTCIGYIPEQKQLLLVKGFESAHSSNILLYDMVTKSWTKGTGRLSVSDAGKNITNLINLWDNKLIYGYENATDETTVVPWNVASTEAINNFKLQTKEYTFGTQAKKKIIKVRMTYKGASGSNTNITPKYSYDGSGFVHFFQDENGVNITNIPGSADWTEIDLYTQSNANGIRGFGLELADEDGATTTKKVANDFEINDITIIFRTKSVK